MIKHLPGLQMAHFFSLDGALFSCSLFGGWDWSCFESEVAVIAGSTRRALCYRSKRLIDFLKSPSSCLTYSTLKFIRSTCGKSIRLSTALFSTFYLKCGRL